MDKLCFRDPYLDRNNTKGILMFEMHVELGHVLIISPLKKPCYSELVASIWSAEENS
jgi:hypothetical protein